MRGAKEPVFVIKPAFKRFGLDNLHIALIALVIILVALAFALSTFKLGPIVYNCPYGVINTTNQSSQLNCITPKYNQSQALSAAESIIASYGSVNSSEAILPYYSLVNEANISYINRTNEWLVSIPYVLPASYGSSNGPYGISLLLSGDNLSLISAYLLTHKPASYTTDKTIALGVVDVNTATPATSKPPFPVYAIVDPYEPGAISSLFTAVNASKLYGNRINMSYKFIYTPEYGERFYSSVGINDTQLLGYYLFCGANQRNFYGFLKNLSIEYIGTPLSNLTLYETAVGSGLNVSSLNACFGPAYNNATQKLDAQVYLVDYYGITQTPAFLVNDKYLTLPQTLNEAINYVLNTTAK